MKNNFVCPKCNCKGQWKPYNVVGEGCDYCKPICRYCDKVMKELPMEHHSKCKAFLKYVEAQRK